jgi:thymidylate kinase
MTRAIAGAGETESDLLPGGGGADLSHFLRSVFDQLDRSAIRYAFLRSPEELADGAAGRCRELDLLVLPDQLSALVCVLRDFGFIEAPRWGYRPHHFFFAFDECNDVWWKLDVVTQLLYGRPIRALPGSEASAVIARMGRNHRLAPQDELVGLVLHCILDHGTFAPRHRRQLLDLWNAFEADEDLRRQALTQVRHHLAPAVTWEELESAVRANDWNSLLTRHRALERQLFLRHPVLSMWRKLAGRVARAGRPFFIAAKHRGVAITLLGPDGAGKTTLGQALAGERPLRAKLIYLGLNPNSANVSLGLTRWLRDRHEIPARVSRRRRTPPKWIGGAGRLVEQWYRYAVAHYNRARGRLIVLDRYPYELQERGRRSFSRQIRTSLFKAGAPVPNLIVVLDAPARTLQERKAEHGLEQLERMRQGYLDLPSRFPNTAIIDTTGGQDAVRRRVTARIWKALGAAQSVRPHEGGG